MQRQRIDGVSGKEKQNKAKLRREVSAGEKKPKKGPEKETQTGSSFYQQLFSFFVFFLPFIVDPGLQGKKNNLVDENITLHGLRWKNKEKNSRG